VGPGLRRDDGCYCFISIISDVSGGTEGGPQRSQVSPYQLDGISRMSAPIIIAGGGIGGLALAIALSQRDIPCVILERATTFSTTGAGIQIGPNGTRLLRQLGVAAHLEPHAGRPVGIHVRRASDGADRGTLPLGAWIEERHGSPYWTAHRGDLQAALLAIAQAQPGIEVRMGWEIASFSETAAAVTAHATDGRSVTGSVLIGADGLWSAVRRQISGITMPTSSRRSAARTVIATADLPAGIRGDHVGVWMAPRVHVVHYPVRGGAETAVAILADEPWSVPGWGADVTAAEALRPVAGLDPLLLDLLNRGQDWRKWSLFDPPPLPHWSTGRTTGRATLLGDAAHPILPFLAQGAVMAIEDAVVLADVLAASATDLAAALAAYETARRPRTRQVQDTARRNGQIYHLSGLAAAARDLALRTVPPAQMMARYDWLYGWQPTSG
jgi:salicylate hydroxylase